MSTAPGLVLQNEDAAPPALLSDWLDARGIDYRLVRAWESGVNEDLDGYSWVCALGADDSTTQSEPEWIPAEIELLGRAVEAGLPVLGICFGGQALARALGGDISAAEPPAIGWYDVRTRDPGLVPSGPWLHFNFERFSVPQDARLLAQGPAGPAAFVVGPSLGVQFHPEVTAEIAEEWIVQAEERLSEAGLDPAALRAEVGRWASRARRDAFRLFDAWWQRAFA